MSEDRVPFDLVGPPGVTFHAVGTVVIANYKGVDLVVKGQQGITLNTGGRRTLSMRIRMNQVIRQLRLPLRVIARGGRWWVSTPTERYYPFVDGMEVPLS